MGASKLGARVRQFRENQGMTREALAENAGVPLATIVLLEEENVYSSIAPLQKIANALSARLGTFLDDVRCADPIIVRAGEREEDLAMQKVKQGKTSYRYHSLGKGKPDRNMEPFFIEIFPDPVEQPALSSHQGEEFIIVVSGTLRVIYGKEEHLLGRGDTIYYNSIVPHYAGAMGDEPCVIYAVIYHP